MDVEKVEREIMILTAAHTSLLSAKHIGCFKGMMDQFTCDVRMAEIGREIDKRMRDLHQHTGNPIYDVWGV